jgi:4-amino-4-deoxy-L-arabinose transferase-like glycosyltransferase
VKKYIVPFLIFLFSLFLLTYNLGNKSLEPWDEAWYASIGKGISQGGPLLDIQFNDLSFWDHPPLGFYLIAVSFRIFGISEFSARLPMVFTACLALVFLYLAGKSLKSPYAGLCATLVATSSRWFLIRARSANLDLLLLFTQLLVFYQAYRAKTKKDVLLLWFFFALSLSAKSVISIFLLPLVLIPTIKILRKEKQKTAFIFKTILVFALPVLPWYLSSYVKYGSPFLERNIWTIALREGKGSGLSFGALSETLLYLRSAIHKWYLPLAISLPAGVVFLKKRSFRWIFAYLFLVSFPFLISSQTRIWHLVPAIAPISLLISLVVFEIYKLTFSFTKNKLKKFYMFGKYLIILSFFLICLKSTKDYWLDTFKIPKTVSNEAFLAIKAKEIDLPLYLQDDTYFPAVVFYADKKVNILRNYNENTLGKIERPFQLISNKHLIENLENYEIIETLGDRVLVITKD